MRKREWFVVAVLALALAFSVGCKKEEAAGDVPADGSVVCKTFETNKDGMESSYKDCTDKKVYSIKCDPADAQGDYDCACIIDGTATGVAIGTKKAFGKLDRAGQDEWAGADGCEFKFQYRP